MSMGLASAVEWEALPHLPEPGGNFVAGAVGSDLILAGGTSWRGDTKQWRDTIWRFDSERAIWLATGKLSQPVTYAAFGESHGRLYFAGGTDGQRTHNTLNFLDRRFAVQTVATFPNPLCYAAAAIADGKLFIVNGAAAANDLKTLTNLFYAVDLQTGKMMSLPAYPGGNVMIPTGSILDGQFYVFGGAAFDPQGNRVINTNAAFAYSIPAGPWKTIKPYPFPVRGLASCTLDERYLLLGGGYKDEFTAESFLYDTWTDSYFATRPLPFAAMSNLVKIGNYVYWVGGEDKMKHRTDLAYRLFWKQLLPENGVK